ncbi:FAD-dependent oxidoreductase [Microbaculum sp. FT89]|uniref:FAD-dependent oxidoreductase n=1 Tax=Microbaculum sp. FT89 TaxID=3447298 RepID=UPI003F532C95
MNATSHSADIVVVGAGGAGLTAAAVAASEGRRVILLEKSRYVGGTAAVSGGAVWIPNNPHLAATGVEDSYENARLFLDTVVGNLASADMKDAFLRRGPEAIRYIEENTDLHFSARPYGPDYLDRPGSSLGGRLMDPAEFDGRELGDRFNDLRPPLPEFGLFGKMMVNRADLEALLAARRSPKAAMHSARVVFRYFRDRLRGYPRGTRLLIGNALAAALYKTLLRKDTPIWLETETRRLLTADGQICGVEVERAGERLVINASAVILASGGFPGSARMRERLLPDAPEPLSAAIADNTGDGIALAEAVGGTIADRNSNGAYWSPVSLVPRDDGSVAHFPHLMFDRAKPGLIAVTSNGKRFTNEADSYHEFVKAMLKQNADNAYLIADSTFLSKYTFGPVPPEFAMRQKFLRSGYLMKADSISGLARQIGIDPNALEATISRYNTSAAKGQDPDFDKGGSPYNRYLGDAGKPGNPCLAPIDKGPFYAIKVFKGDIGTCRGLDVNTHAQVLDAAGAPIPGLYACGNDMNSMMGGEYPGPGITIGQAITFGYVAAIHAAGIKDA